MSDWLLFDPLFRIPFWVGLCLAGALSLIGALLRMRNEWLAALALSQIAAAGGMLSVLLHWPVLVGACAAAALVMLVRALSSAFDNNHYALVILIGWSATLLLGTFIDHGQGIAESLLRGQLYFTHVGHLAGAAILFLGTAAAFPWLSPRLLTARFFPDYHRANRIVSWPFQGLFAVLVIGAAVLGTISLGAFPAFALLFVPSWVGFVWVDGWNRSIWVSVFVGVAVYAVAFVVALLTDMPFGPVLTALLALTCCLRFMRRT